LTSYFQSINNTAADNIAVGPIAQREEAELGFALGVEDGPEACPETCPDAGESVAEEAAVEEALGGEPLFALMIFTALTGLVLLLAFWYDALWPSNCARDIMFQLFCCITGYADMKVATDWFDSSCSRIISPGLFGPVSHCCIEALTLAAVCVGGESERAQSLVSWFQITVVKPNTCLAMADTRLSLSP